MCELDSSYLEKDLAMCVIIIEASGFSIYLLYFTSLLFFARNFSDSG